jgi:hypothetical protein
MWKSPEPGNFIGAATCRSTVKVLMVLRATKGNEDSQRVRGGTAYARGSDRRRDRTRALASEGAVAFPPSATRVFNRAFDLHLIRAFVL